MLKETFTAVIDRDNRPSLIAFLKNLTDKEKKELIPVIKSLYTYYNEFGNIRGNEYGYLRGTDNKRNMLQTAILVCGKMSDFEKLSAWNWMAGLRNLDDVLDWYQPSWLSDFINKQAANRFLPHDLTYEFIMRLAEAGYISPSPELIARLLPSIILTRDKNDAWQFDFSQALHREITLREHLWLLFEFETTIHNVGRYHINGDKKDAENSGWISLLKKYSSENRINRARLLKESLLASNRNFDKVLSGWFADLFALLEADKQELLALQKELFSVLSSSLSKPVNIALQSIKKIVSEKEFDREAFLDILPILLSSEVKSLVSSALQIAEKAAGKDEILRHRVCVATCQVFLKKDSELQLRAAKIITKLGDKNNEQLRNEISACLDNILADSKKLIAEYIDEPAEKNTADNVETLGAPSVFDKIPFPANIDDLVFLVSQCADNNEPWHIDVIAASLVKFAPELTGDDILRLEPAFQRALNFVGSWGNSTSGHLEHLISRFVIDFGLWAKDKFPGITQRMKEIYERYNFRDHKNVLRSWWVTPEYSSYTAEWNIEQYKPNFEPYRKIFIGAIDKIKTGSKLPLLSTPTHFSSWVDAEVLIRKLVAYQESGDSPGEMDFQVAIARCISFNDEMNVQTATALLKGEFRELMLFVLGSSSPQGNFYHKNAWITASLSKMPVKVWPALSRLENYQKEIGNHIAGVQWTPTIEEYSYPAFELNKRIEKIATRKVLKLEAKHLVSDPDSLVKRLLGKFKKPAKASEMLYNLLFNNGGYESLQNDIKRILSLTPTNHEATLAAVINEGLRFPDYYSESVKRLAAGTLEYLHSNWKPGSTSYLFLGLCMLHIDKTVTNIASEIWINAVATQQMDNQQLGQVIGKLEAAEFAPLKRFTGLASHNLFRVSKLHDKNLKELVDCIVLYLNGKQIKNLKKLIDIQKELSHTNCI